MDKRPTTIAKRPSSDRGLHHLEHEVGVRAQAGERRGRLGAQPAEVALHEAERDAAQVVEPALLVRVRARVRVRVRVRD